MNKSSEKNNLSGMFGAQITQPNKQNSSKISTIMDKLNPSNANLKRSSPHAIWNSGSFNIGEIKGRLGFVNNMFKIANLTQLSIDIYAHAGAIYDKKEQTYIEKIQYTDYVDVLIGVFAQLTYWDSFELGGIVHEKYFTRYDLLFSLNKSGVNTNMRLIDHRIKRHITDKMIDRHVLKELSSSAQAFILGGLKSESKPPKYVYVVSQRSLKIATMVNDEPERYQFALSHISEKSNYVKIMVESINSLDTQSRHDIIDLITP